MVNNITLCFVLTFITEKTAGNWKSSIHIKNPETPGRKSGWNRRLGSTKSACVLCGLPISSNWPLFSPCEDQFCSLSLSSFFRKWVCAPKRFWVPLRLKQLKREMTVVSQQGSLPGGITLQTFPGHQHLPGTQLREAPRSATGNQSLTASLGHSSPRHSKAFNPLFLQLEQQLGVSTNKKLLSSVSSAFPKHWYARCFPYRP